MRYQFIRDHAIHYPITLLCKTLRVSRSGYYAWRNCPVSLRTQEDERLFNKIKLSFDNSKETYGSPRIHGELRHQGETCGLHRVARIMRNRQMMAKPRRRYCVTTDSSHDLPVANNVLDRQFSVDSPNKVWLSDITYIPTSEGWLYLAAIMDLAFRGIVGWATSDRIDRKLACDALIDAFNRRRPAPGLLHHSDRGSQYVSADYQALLANHGALPSMSRKGNCWDNAPMESFFHSMKTEWLNDQRFRTKQEARQAVFKYIEVWYNRKRLHSTLGYRSPEQYEQLLTA